MSLYRNDHFVWVEKHRPRKISDCILTPTLKTKFESIVNSGKIQNMTLCGSAGTGKTTVAKALCNELDYEVLFINASKENSVDDIRTKVYQFGSTLSLEDKRKAIILDEADFLSLNAQSALRGVVEEFASNCVFILTCNFENKLIPALISRCPTVDYRLRKEDKKSFVANVYKRMVHILKEENVEFNDKVLLKLCVKYTPDVRRLLMELQSYSQINNKIDEGALALVKEINVTKLIEALKTKNFADVRTWVIENVDNDYTLLYRKIYDSLFEYLDDNSIPQSVLLIGDYMHKSAFSADQEITLLAFFTEIMIECEFA